MWRPSCISLLVLGLLSAQAAAEIFLKPTPPFPYKYWTSDTLFVGAGLLVDDKDKEVIVKWVYGSGNTGVLTYEAKLDSSIHIFHNHPDLFPDDDTLVNLGFFPKGNSLIFGYSVQSDLGVSHRYTGQNRTGVDDYTSTVKGNYGRAWALVGRVNDTLVEVGFEYYTGNTFRAMVFTISNVLIEGIEKYKIPRVRFEQNWNEYSQTASVAGFVPIEGLCTVLVRGLVNKDTVNSIEEKAIQIFYSTDSTYPTINSDPFVSEIRFDSPKSIRAVAIAVNDSAWLDADVAVFEVVFPTAACSLLKTKPVSSGAGKMYMLNGRFLENMILHSCRSIAINRHSQALNWIVFQKR